MGHVTSALTNSQENLSKTRTDLETTQKSLQEMNEKCNELQDELTNVCFQLEELQLKYEEDSKYATETLEQTVSEATAAQEEWHTKQLEMSNELDVLRDLKLASEKASQDAGQFIEEL